jgi:hypothetical protein
MGTTNILQWFWKYDGILTFTLKDADDALVDGATVACVVKDPAGTTLDSGPATGTGGGTGEYTYDLAFDMSGVSKGDILTVEATFTTTDPFHAYQEVSVEVVVDKI